MFFKKKKKQDINIVLCIHSSVLCESVKKILQESPEAKHVNYNILEEFYYGRPCIDYVRKNLCYIDIIIVDAEMEGVNGYEVCRKIRELSMNVPILLFSQEKKKLLQAKEMYYINEVLLHPWQPSYLWTRIDNIVDSINKGKEE